ncbi:helix-turn-helix domain-containing protein [Paenibacillus sp. LMG 31456]|uniref:Helix-turn-helix domain-containing protein n=1 Tax=Paenibacillus foliorum TaxID=2654974 RepID=A0A972JY98_9BACL|nr:AraC family transcriptional regulator [Paenibacillus foliorum]NOU92331.1 helix-turn-helix domain-containing protein [Paenibacillus foliorum]
MTIRRTIGSMHGQMFFEPGFPLYVNRASESFELLEHSHDFVEITYVSEGKGFHYIRDEIIAVQKGDLFFIPVGTSHVFRPAHAAAKDKLIVYNCLFHEQLFEQMAGNYSELLTSADRDVLLTLQKETTWFQQKEQFGEIGVLMSRLHIEFSQAKAARRFMLLSYVIQLLVLLYRSRQPVGQGAELLLENNRMDEVLGFIQQQLQNPPSLPEIAAKINVGPRQFHRLIKQATGQTYTEYLHNVRIQKCCELLNRTNSKISEIAELAGYQDMKYFHSLFKRITGMSPQQFRKQSVKQ